MRIHINCPNYIFWKVTLGKIISGQLNDERGRSERLRPGVKSAFPQQHLLHAPPRRPAYASMARIPASILMRAEALAECTRIDGG